jgi:hypothetical protein
MVRRSHGRLSEREIKTMNRIATLTSLVLASLLACACADSTDEGAEQGTGAATAGRAEEPKPSVEQNVPKTDKSEDEGAGLGAEILGTDGLSLATLGRYLGPDGSLLVIHNPGAHLAFEHVKPLEAGGESHVKTFLRSLLTAPISGEVIPQEGRIVSFDCDSEKWTGDHMRPVDPSKLYSTRIDTADFDGVLAQLALSAAEPTAELAQSLEDLEMKVEVAISVPSKPLVLYFGRVEGGAWRLHAIDIVTPCDA